MTLALRRSARLASRASVPFVLATLTLLSVPAHADAAEGWDNPPQVGVLHALLLLGGVPLLLIVVIGLFVYVPSLVRGEGIAPGGATAEAQWIGGPREPKALPAAEADADETGGARGSW